MKSGFEEHCTEEALESYAIGTLSGTSIETLEEHILICEDCRVRLDEADRYVHAMRNAALHLRKEAEASWLARIRSFFAVPTGVLAASAALLVVVFVSTYQLRSNRAGRAPVAIEVPAERGSTTQAPAHEPLDLKLDTRGLRFDSTVRLELVDDAGRLINQRTVETNGGNLGMQREEALDPGSYFVRLYSRNSSEPLREYSVQVK